MIPIGAFRCYPIADGDLLYPRATLAGQDLERVAAFPEQVAVPYTPLLVDTGTHRVLIDTGAGPLAPSAGFVETSLQRAGYQTADVDTVVISHAHPDHIGGLLREDGSARFPNARILISEKEYDFWHSAELQSRLGSGGMYGDVHLEQVMKAWVERYLTPLRERLEWVVDEAEIAPGLVAMHTPGHTPGHMAIAISCGSNSMVYAADALVVAGQVSAPSWTTMFDLDPQTLIATRKKLLDRCATDQSIMFHYHFGGVGVVRRKGGQMEWEAIA